MRVGAVAALVLLSACAHPLVSDGRLQQEPFERLSARTELVTGTPHPADLRALPVTRAEIPGILRRVIESQWGDEELRDYQDALIAMGLWPRERDLLEVTLAVFETEVVGFYVPADRTLYVVSDADVPMLMELFTLFTGRDLYREAVLAHELVHAHQHSSHPRLLDTSLRSPDQGDAAMAASAVLEGDALRAGFEVSLRSAAPPDPRQVELAFAGEAQGKEAGPLADAPALIRLTYVFPYVQGYRLAHAEGSALLDAPPASTEQLMHPERRRADFLALDLSRVAEGLPSECRFLFEDTVGELNLSVLFRDHAEAVAPAIWEGWDGDRYVAARCRGRREFLWLTCWDSVADAEDFEAAYRAIAASVAERAELSGPPVSLRDGSRVIVLTEGLEALLPWVEVLARPARVDSLEALEAHFASSELESESSARTRLAHPVVGGVCSAPW